jgi:hypothetical protein
MDAARKAYDEIVELCARGTQPAKVLAFRPSRKTQERVRYLLVRNKTGELTEEETTELDGFPFRWASLRYGIGPPWMQIGDQKKISFQRRKGSPNSVIYK